jgi:hypothetical protein
MSSRSFDSFGDGLTAAFESEAARSIVGDRFSGVFRLIGVGFGGFVDRFRNCRRPVIEDFTPPSGPCSLQE